MSPECSSYWSSGWTDATVAILLSWHSLQFLILRYTLSRAACWSPAGGLRKGHTRVTFTTSGRLKYLRLQERKKKRQATKLNSFRCVLIFVEASDVMCPLPGSNADKHTESIWVWIYTPHYIDAWANIDSKTSNVAQKWFWAQASNHIR